MTGVNPVPTEAPALLRNWTKYPVIVAPSAFWDLIVSVDVVPVTTVNILASVFPLEFVAATEWGPAAADAGTENVAENVPVAVVVMVAGLLVNTAPSNVSLMVDAVAKLDPVIVTDVPVAPDVGLSVIWGAACAKLGGMYANSDDASSRRQSNTTAASLALSANLARNAPSHRSPLRFLLWFSIRETLNL